MSNEFSPLNKGHSSAPIGGSEISAGDIAERLKATASEDPNDVVREKLLDAEVPGYEVEFDAEEAKLAGAFTEDALSLDDAKESVADGQGADDLQRE